MDKFVQNSEVENFKPQDFHLHTRSRLMDSLITRIDLSPKPLGLYDTLQKKFAL